MSHFPLQEPGKGTPMDQDSDRWVRELTAAGWSQWVNQRGQKRSDMWVHPNGEIYRGPYRAWQIMKAEETQWRKKAESPR